MKLRDYQEDCISKMRLALTSGEKRLLVKAPCSFGKTIVFCAIAQMAKEKGNSVLIVMDSVFLVKQTVEKLAHFTSDVGVYCGSLNRKELKTITVGTIQSLKKIDFSILIVDEVHSGYSRTSKFLKDFQGIIIGFTATPYNAKGMAIYGEDKFFNKLTYAMTANELLERKIITPMVYGCEKEETKISLKNVSIVNGDYKESELQKVYEIEKDKVKSQVIDMIARTSSRKKIIIMCTGIDHANYVESILDSSLAYHSGLKLDDREERINKFKSGKVKYFIGVMAIYKGLDIPSVDCITNMRPTRSKSFYCQLAGRGVRYFEGKLDCLFLDYGQTVETLGFYEDITESIRKDSKGIAPEFYPKKCPACLALVKPQIKICECGYIFKVVITDKLEMEAFTRNNLNEVDVTDIIIFQKHSEKSAKIQIYADNYCYEVFYPTQHDFGRIRFHAHSKAIKVGSRIKFKRNSGNFWEIVAIWNGKEL